MNPRPTPTGSDVASSPIFKKLLGKAQGYVQQPTRMKQLLTDAYHKASEKNELGNLAHEAWDTLQVLFRLVRSSVSGEYTGLPTTTTVAAVAVLIYFLSPIDLIPDFIPVLGLLDDVALVGWFMSTLKGEVDKFHEWELTRPALAAADEAPTASPTRPETAAPAHSNAVARHGHAPSAPASAEEMAAAPAAPAHGDATANTTDSSRTGNRDAAADTGGNVR